MKKTLSILLVSVILLLPGCGGEQRDGGDGSSTVQPADTAQQAFAETTGSTAPATTTTATPVHKAASIAICETGLGDAANDEYEVRITFLGISVFNRLKEANGVIEVMLPDLEAGRKEAPDPENRRRPLRQAIEKHVAYILGDRRTMPTTGVMDAKREGTCFKFLPLKSKAIVTVDEASAPMNRNKVLCITEAHNGRMCPDSATRGSMKWLPSLKEILGAEQKPNPAHFTSRDALAASIMVDRGYMETVSITKNIWGFRVRRRDADANVQAIPQEVRWHMRGKGNEFVLMVNGSPIKFKPLDKRVDLVIGNTMEDDIGPLGPIQTPSADHHFRVYYEFIEGNPTPELGPVPHTARSGTCGANPAISTRALKGGVICIGQLPPGEPTPGSLNCGGTNWP